VLSIRKYFQYPVSGKHQLTASRAGQASDASPESRADALVPAVADGTDLSCEALDGGCLFPLGLPGDGVHRAGDGPRPVRAGTRASSRRWKNGRSPPPSAARSPDGAARRRGARSARGFFAALTDTEGAVAWSRPRPAPLGRRRAGRPAAHPRPAAHHPIPVGRFRPDYCTKSFRGNPDMGILPLLPAAGRRPRQVAGHRAGDGHRPDQPAWRPSSPSRLRRKRMYHRGNPRDLMYDAVV
jgi:hypothetical protein